MRRAAGHFFLALIGVTAAALILSAGAYESPINWFMAGFSVAMFVAMFVIYLMTQITIGGK